MERAGVQIDTAYRSMGMESLQALRLAALRAIEAVAGEGQAYSLNGRQVTHASLEKWVRQLASCDAAIAFKNGPDAAHGNGFVRRYSDFSSEC